jgi:predicted nucleic acid-binding protein
MLNGDAELIIPDLHYWEFGNVLRTYVMRKEISADLARELFEIHLLSPLTIYSPHRMEVLKTALTYHSTMYDAVFIRSSLELDLPFITAEKTTTPWVDKLSKRIIPIR